jgi:hypothetical protein
VLSCFGGIFLITGILFKLVSPDSNDLKTLLILNSHKGFSQTQGFSLLARNPIIYNYLNFEIITFIPTISKRLFG